MTNTTSAHPSSARSRELERDIRAWKKFTGMKHTEAVRVVDHPLAQGILGDRICARDVIRVLTEHPILSGVDEESDGSRRATHLGYGGLHSAQAGQQPLIEPDRYLVVILSAEFLRAFTRTTTPQAESSSYNLKHTAEQFLGEHLAEYSYINNGQIIWAAAALGLPVAESLPGELSSDAQFGLPPDEVDYARRMRRNTRASGPVIRAHHHRPPGYLHLQRALEQYKLTGETPARWDGIDHSAEPSTSPFHAWLVDQAEHSEMLAAFGTRDAFLVDYREGARTGAHRVATEPQDLLEILHALGTDTRTFGIARGLELEWGARSGTKKGIRTERVHEAHSEHDGWGAGDGDIEKYEYLCPCENGRILEEHDNIPGFREHDVRIMCSECSKHWKFAAGKSMREWSIEPIAVTSEEA